VSFFQGTIARGDGFPQENKKMTAAKIAAVFVLLKIK
jgi:hypothetical protein